MTIDATTDPRFSGLPGRPGKIIAVHLSYDSRARQRGRRPATPSYFFKPSSSVASSPSVVARPPGTELLAFEGEIALVIGTAARHVPLDRAWEHVGWVTAANDLGLYDLRASDKGSNVRSKGGDGYTPLGPSLLDARSVDPTSLRLRTWVNGEIRQDDTTAGLIFPLAQFVADLSQHVTLEPGDVILTGTPAGSSVIVPGDVVEVEVDSPATGLSTGRLVTSVVEGDGPAFDASIGSLPAVDDLQRAEAWGHDPAETVTAPAQRDTVVERAQPATVVERAQRDTVVERAQRDETHSASRATLSAEVRKKLERVPVAALSQQLRKRGLDNVTIDGVRPLHPHTKLVGTARTLRFVPLREDLFASHGGGHNAQKRVFDAVEAGEVIVIEARGEVGSGTLGDILAIRAHARGAAGIVTDGGVRDLDAVTAVGIPVYTAGGHPAVLGRKHVPWDHDVTIACGGTSVQPGDILVGDADGVIVLPPSMAEDVADAALAQEEEDAWVADRVAEGHPVDGLFPMNAEWRARFEAREPAVAEHREEKP